MTLHDLMYNWPDFTYQRKMNALKTVLGSIEDTEAGDEILWDLLNAAAELEDDDFFGTEGLQI